MRLTKLIRSLSGGYTLSDRVRSIFEAGGHREYTLPHIVQKVSPAAVEDVAAALSELTQKREIEKVLRVESPINSGGIKDFSSASEIPDEMYDPRSNQMIQVRPENVRVLFRRRAAR